MKIVFFDDHVLVNDGRGGVNRLTYADAMKLAVQLNNRFALKARAEREEEQEDARA